MIYALRARTNVLLHIALRYIEKESDEEEAHDASVQLDMDDNDHAPSKPNDGKKKVRCKFIL